jgi:hypothetical protein
MVYNKYVNMRFIESLCPPALLYLIFLVIQLGLDLALGMWVTFAIKLVLGLAVVKVLDTFCGIGLSPVSWFVVSLRHHSSWYGNLNGMQLRPDHSHSPPAGRQ